MHGARERGVPMSTLSFRASGNTADRPRNSFARPAGFTLLEVMIALAIMAGVILTVISSFNYHLSVVSRDREETIAVLLARAKLDDPAFKITEAAKGTFAPDWPDITWAADIKPVEQYPGVNRLTFKVSWDAARRNISLVRYQAQ